MLLAKILPSLGALALVAAAGAGLQAMGPARLERSLIARLGLAYLLGCAWVGFGAWVASFVLGLPLALPLIFALVSAPIVAGTIVAVRRRRESRGWGIREFAVPGWAALLAATLVAAQCAALLASAASEPLNDFDGRMTWGTQAKYLRAAESALPELLRDPRAFVVHPRYPILMPLLQVATVELAGGELEGFGVRPLYALFLPAFAAALWPALRRVGKPLGALFAVLVLFGSPIVLNGREGGPLGTYSDFPLAAFLGIGLAQLLHPRTRSAPWRGAFAGLLLAAASGCKNEGLILGVAALVGCAFLLRRSATSHRRAVLNATIVVAFAVTTILWWKSAIPNRNDEAYLETMPIAEAVANLPGAVGPISGEIASRMADRSAWGYLVWILPPVIALGARGLRRRACRAALVVIGAELATVFAAYAAAADVAIVGVTWNRFVIQAFGPLSLLAAASAGRVYFLARQKARSSRPPQ